MKNLKHLIIIFLIAVVTFGVYQISNLQNQIRANEDKYDNEKALLQTTIANLEVELDQQETENDMNLQALRNLVQEAQALNELVEAYQEEAGSGLIQTLKDQIDNLENQVFLLKQQSNNEIDLSELLVGYWTNSNSIGSSSRNAFHFFADGSFISSNDGYINQFFGTTRTLWSSGSWLIKDGLLYISITSDFYLEGGTPYFDSISGLSYDGAEITKRVFDYPKVIIYDIQDRDDTEENSVINREFNGLRLYRLLNDPSYYLDNYENIKAQLN